MRQQSLPASLFLFREIAALIRQGVLRSEIGRTYPLSAVKEAVEQAVKICRQGKVLLKLAEAG
jgi:NADPH:quinone reductase